MKLPLIGEMKVINPEGYNVFIKEMEKRTTGDFSSDFVILDHVYLIEVEPKDGKRLFLVLESNKKKKVE